MEMSSLNDRRKVKALPSCAGGRLREARRQRALDDLVACHAGRSGPCTFTVASYSIPLKRQPSLSWRTNGDGADGVSLVVLIDGEVLDGVRGLALVELTDRALVVGLLQQGAVSQTRLVGLAGRDLAAGDPELATPAVPSCRDRAGCRR